ncbi:MAG: hypothetical protein ACTSXL_05695 [Alphaproteobacteria bacterium]
MKTKYKVLIICGAIVFILALGTLITKKAAPKTYDKAKAKISNFTENFKFVTQKKFDKYVDLTEVRLKAIEAELITLVDNKEAIELDIGNIETELKGKLTEADRVKLNSRLSAQQEKIKFLKDQEIVLKAEDKKLQNQINKKEDKEDKKLQNQINKKEDKIVVPINPVEPKVTYDDSAKCATLIDNYNAFFAQIKAVERKVNEAETRISKKEAKGINTESGKTRYLFNKINASNIEEKRITPEQKVILDILKGQVETAFNNFNSKNNKWKSKPGYDKIKASMSSIINRLTLLKNKKAYTVNNSVIDNANQNFKFQNRHYNNVQNVINKQYG